MPAAPGPAARWRRRTPAERRALVEAAALLAAASLIVKLARFRTIARLAARPVHGVPPADPDATILVITWAIRAVARRARFRAVCIEQGLAAQIMLRRRGLATTLHYGVAKQADAGLSAHVWVRHGVRDVIGCEQAERFRLLASFPDDAPPRG